MTDTIFFRLLAREDKGAALLESVAGVNAGDPDAPDTHLADPQLAEYLEIALEGRRRVKEQLKKMGAFEYYQTSFSYIKSDTREEHFVGVPEEGGRDLISPDPLQPGTVYGACLTPDDKIALFRVEVTVLPGSGKLRVAGMPPPGPCGSRSSPHSTTFAAVVGIWA